MPDDKVAVTAAGAAATGSLSTKTPESTRASEITQEKREEALQRLLQMEATLKADAEASEEAAAAGGVNGGESDASGDARHVGKEEALAMNEKLEELKMLMESNLKLDPNMSAEERAISDAAFDKLVSCS